MKIKAKRKGGDKPEIAKSTSKIQMQTANARKKKNYPKPKSNLYSPDSVNVGFGDKNAFRVHKKDMLKSGPGTGANRINARKLPLDKTGKIKEPWRYKEPVK